MPPVGDGSWKGTMLTRETTREKRKLGHKRDTKERVLTNQRAQEWFLNNLQRGTHRHTTCRLRTQCLTVLRAQDTMTIDQIEEHGLVLAIQAAHHASRLQQGNISSYSSSASSGVHFQSSRDSDREEAGLPAHNAFSSNQLGAPRERKSGSKFLSRSRSLPSEREDTDDSSLDSEAGYVHFEEKPSAELFLVGLLSLHLCLLHSSYFFAVLGMHMMSCLLLGTVIVALPIWMTMPYRGGGLGYSVKDCAVVMSCAGVMILLTQINTESRIKVSLRAFPVRTFRSELSPSAASVLIINPLSSRRVGVGSLAFFSFLLTQFGRINRLQFSGFSGHNTALQIPNPSSSSSSIGGTLLWFIHILFGIEHFTSPSAENDGTVVSGSYWIPTPSANPLTMVIPGILIGSVSKSFILFLLLWLTISSSSLILCLYSLLCLSHSQISCQSLAHLLELCHLLTF
jgi:hypothetical protein